MDSTLYILNNIETTVFPGPFCVLGQFCFFLRNCKAKGPISYFASSIKCSTYDTEYCVNKYNAYTYAMYTSYRREYYYMLYIA